MGDFATLGGTLGGFSTIIVIFLSYINGCCTKNSYKKYVEEQRAIYAAEMLGTPEVIEETIPESSVAEEEEVIESSSSSEEPPYEAWITIHNNGDERIYTPNQSMMHLGQSECNDSSTWHMVT